MAGLSAVLYFAGRASPLPIVFFLASVVPLMHAGLRCGLRAALLAALAASALTGLLAGPAPALSHALPFGLMGPLMVWLVSRPRVGRWHLLAVAGATGGAVFAKFYLLFWLMGNELPLAGVRLTVEQSLQLHALLVRGLLRPLDTLVAPRSALAPAADFLRWAWGAEFHRLLGRCLCAAPVGIAIAVGLQLIYFTHAFSASFFRRLGLSLPPAPRPADFRLGPRSYVVLAVSHALVLSHFRGAPLVCAVLGANGLALLAVGYFALGLGAVQRVFRTRVVGDCRVLAALCLVGIALSPLLIVTGFLLSAVSAPRENPLRCA